MVGRIPKTLRFEESILGDIGPDAQAAIQGLQLVAENDQYGTLKQAARTALAKIRRKR